MSVPATLRRQVWERDGNRCEYCQMAQDYDPATFEVDHVIPEKMDGTTAFENLALACFKCNNHKGPNIAGMDPESGARAFLYDPRKDN
jgi:5-methylcytosine-specific restriction endonuclease McrA